MTWNLFPLGLVRHCTFGYVCLCRRVQIQRTGFWLRSFPRKNARLKKSSHETLDAERTSARLLYLTQSGGHRVSSTRKGDPAPRFLTNCGRETHLLRPSAFPPRHCLGLRRDKKDHTTGLASTWDTIPANA